VILPILRELQSRLSPRARLLLKVWPEQVRTEERARGITRSSAPRVAGAYPSYSGVIARGPRGVLCADLPAGSHL